MPNRLGKPAGWAHVLINTATFRPDLLQDFWMHLDTHMGTWSHLSFWVQRITYEKHDDLGRGAGFCVKSSFPRAFVVHWGGLIMQMFPQSDPVVPPMLFFHMCLVGLIFPWHVGSTSNIPNGAPPDPKPSRVGPQVHTLSRVEAFDRGISLRAWPKPQEVWEVPQVSKVMGTLQAMGDKRLELQV